MNKFASDNTKPTANEKMGPINEAVKNMQLKTDEKVKLQSFIDAHGVSAKLIEKGSSEATMMAHELLKSQGYDVKPDQMIKALVCIPLEGKEFLKDKAILAMVSGPSKLDLKRLAAIFGHERIIIADQQTAESLSGYPRGGTPPIGHETKLRVVMDSVLFGQEMLYGGGGETTKIIQITPTEIKRALEAEGEEFRVADIRQ